MYKHISSQLLVEGNIMYGEREEGQLGEKTLRLKKSWASAAVTDLHTQTLKLGPMCQTGPSQTEVLGASKVLEEFQQAPSCQWRYS